MIKPAKFLGLSLLGSGFVLAALLLIPIGAESPPAPPKPVVQARMEDPRKREEELKKKLEEEMQKRLEEERRKLLEEQRRKEEQRKIAEERRRVEEDRSRLEEERRRIEEERRRLAETPPAPTPEEIQRMIDEAVREAAATAPAPQVPPPAPQQAEAPKLAAEPAPELPAADRAPAASRKGGFFIYVDPPDSDALDALRRNGFALAVADEEGFVTHVVRLDAANQVSGYKEFDRDDRSLYADVMFRIRPRRVQGVGPIDREVGRRFEGASLKLLILRTTFNREVGPLIRDARALAEEHRLDFDGIRLRVDAEADSLDWEGFYSRGMFYRR